MLRELARHRQDKDDNLIARGRGSPRPSRGVNPSSSSCPPRGIVSSSSSRPSQEPDPSLDIHQTQDVGSQSRSRPSRPRGVGRTSSSRARDSSRKRQRRRDAVTAQEDLDVPFLLLKCQCKIFLPTLLALGGSQVLHLVSPMIWSESMRSVVIQRFLIVLTDAD